MLVSLKVFKHFNYYSTYSCSDTFSGLKTDLANTSMVYIFISLCGCWEKVLKTQVDKNQTGNISHLM